MINELEKEIPEETENELLEKENVIGVGRGRKRVDGQLTDEEVIVTFVEKKVAEDELDEDQLVPQSLEIDDQDVDTDVQEASGGFYAQEQQPRQLPPETAQSGVGTGGSGEGQQTASQPGAEPQAVSGPFGQDRKDRWRPLAPAGVSIGHPQISAGTLGSPPLITQGGERVFLTNAHVAAPAGKAERGDSCLQPGKYDGGTDSEDKIGELLEWSELSEDANNTSDSALVQITGNVENDILGVGQLRGWTEANYEEDHTKSGRTTGTTSADLIARDVTALVNYGSPFSKPLRFTGLDAFEAFSAGGDSGSLIGIQRQNGSFHGTDLLFAGSSRQTLGIPMDAVQKEHGKLRVQKKQQMNDQQQHHQTGPAQGGQQQQFPQSPSEVPPDLQQGQTPTQQGDGAVTETATTTQATYTALTGYLNANQTVYRWHGGWHPGYSVQYSVRPTTNSRAVSGSVYYTWRDANGQLWYLLQIQNRSGSATYYDVRATYEYV